MWYSMIGCLLTIALGLIISVIFNFIQKRNVLKISTSQTATLEDSTWHPELKTEFPSDVKVTPIVPSTIDKLGHVNLAYA